jgi:plasmid stabilization system protein ParE
MAAIARGKTVPDEEVGAWLEQRGTLLSANLYIVVYRFFEERVLILNVVHGAQRWP